jgi:ankyrin repeat protein
MKLRFWVTAMMLMAFRREVVAMVAPEKVFDDPKVISLARAIAEGNLADVQKLLAAGADVKAKGKDGFTVTQFALYARQNGPEVLRVILKAGADPISRLSDGNDVPHYAASRDKADPRFMAVLLDFGVSPDFIGGGENNSLLDAAVSGRNIPIVKLLLERGANVNYNDPFVGTALHTALTIPDYEIATILLDHGADPSLRNNQDPKIGAEVQRRTPAELYCRFQSGKRKHASPEQNAAFEEMKKAFARRGVVLPCGI